MLRQFFSTGTLVLHQRSASKSIFHLTRNTIPKTLRILPYRARPIREMVTVTFFKDVRNDYLYSPSSSSMSYIHSPIYEDEIDVDWGKYAGDITESKMKWIRKKAGKLACVGMSSILRWWSHIVHEILWHGKSLGESYWFDETSYLQLGPKFVHSMNDCNTKTSRHALILIL